MKSIIGMHRGEGDVARSIQRLKDVGLPEDNISVHTQVNAIQKILGCEPPNCVISRYAAWGASLGIAAYALPATLAGLCQCNLFHYGQAYGIGTFLGGILAGAFVGGGLGFFIGAAEFDKDSNLYVQGARMGGSLIVITVSEENTDRVKLVLEQEKASGVKVL
jgi:hypothetical protein